MIKLVFKAVKMNCPAEEQLIRLHFTGSPAVIQLQFDLPSRQLTVLHTGEVAPIAQALDGLKLGSSLVDSIPLEAKKYHASCASKGSKNPYRFQERGYKLDYVIRLFPRSGSGHTS